MPPSTHAPQARAYSVSGIAKMLEGEVTQSVLDKKLGVRRLENRDALAPLIDNMTRYRSQSIFAETFAATLHEALASSEHLGAELEPLSLATTFPSESLAQQLEQTARVIKARAALGKEQRLTQISAQDSQACVDRGSRSVRRRTRPLCALCSPNESRSRPSRPCLCCRRGAPSLLRLSRWVRHARLRARERRREVCHRQRGPHGLCRRDEGAGCVGASGPP